MEEFVLENCPCHCESVKGAGDEHLVTASELRALEMRGVQRDDKVKMQLSMKMSKIETRIQKLGACALLPMYSLGRPETIDFYQMLTATACEHWRSCLLAEDSMSIVNKQLKAAKAEATKAQHTAKKKELQKKFTATERGTP